MIEALALLRLAFLLPFGEIKKLGNLHRHCRYLCITPRRGTWPSGALVPPADRQRG